jgi:hypothetical protein
MDTVQLWSERIAQRLTPAETDFAADVGKAYASGGHDRKDLFPRHNAQPGAFGPGAMAMELPWILLALDHAGNAVLAVLRSQYLANTLAAGSLLVALRQDHDSQALPRNSTQADRKTPPTAPGTPETPLNERQAVSFAFDSLSERLQATGFTLPRANELAFGLLEELLMDIAGATAFLNALGTATADEQRDNPGTAPHGIRNGWLRRRQR